MTLKTCLTLASLIPLSLAFLPPAQGKTYSQEENKLITQCFQNKNRADCDADPIGCHWHTYIHNHK